jgi:chloramphenicol 3-O phosphotransferase
LAEAGNDVVTELIIEDRAQLVRLEEELFGLEVFWVGLHVPVEELERRERERGDRRSGDAQRDARTVHTFRRYDLELDGTVQLDDNIKRVVAAWSG